VTEDLYLKKDILLLKTIVKYCENIEDFINAHGSD